MRLKSGDMLQLQIDNETLTNLCWFLTVGLGLACLQAAYHLFTQLVQRTQESPLPRRAAYVLFGRSLGFGLLCLQLIAWQIYFGSPGRDRLDAGLMVLVLAICFAIWHRIEHKQLCRVGFATWQHIAVHGLQIAGLACLAQVFSVATVATNLSVDPPGRLVIAESQYAVTDAGTRIDFYQRQIADEDFAEFVKQSRQQIAGITKYVMLRAEPVAQSNCHGWVFAGGQHIIRNDDVPLILAENGYYQVDEPASGDVIVYRDVSGQVVHTGLVCGFLHDQGPLVESKWGIDGTYVHLANEQPYSLDFQYWRSPRSGHLLRTYAVPRQPAGVPLELASVAPLPRLLQ